MAINKIIYDVTGEKIVDIDGHVTVYGIDGHGDTVNKVIYGANVLMDVSDTTASVSDVAMGETFYTNDGVKRTGTKSDAETIDIDTSTGTVSGESLIISSGGGSISLQSKTATPSENTQTIMPDSGYDGLSQVTINPIPSSYIVPVGTKTIDANGTYDVTDYASAVVNVSGGSSGNFKTGSVTFTSTYNTTDNRLIVSLADIGFTPKQFYLMIADKTTVSGIQYVILRASFETDDNNGYIRTTTRYSNTSNTVNTSNSATNWTTQTNYYLYNDGTNIYIRTTSTFIISANTTYNWIAIG